MIATAATVNTGPVARPAVRPAIGAIARVSSSLAPAVTGAVIAAAAPNPHAAASDTGAKAPVDLERAGVPTVKATALPVAHAFPAPPSLPARRSPSPLPAKATTRPSPLAAARSPEQRALQLRLLDDAIARFRRSGKGWRRPRRYVCFCLRDLSFFFFFRKRAS